MELLFINVFNYGAIELAKNHAQSLKQNNINNYMMYVTDIESDNELLNIGIKSTLLSDNFFTDISLNYGLEKNNFDTEIFNDMSYLRYLVINKLLKDNKIVWYMDVDTVVMSDLNIFFNKIKNSKNNVDLYMQDDINMPCTGCMLFFPNETTINFTNIIYNSKNAIYCDQILIKKFLINYGNYINCMILPRNQFVSGLLYFDEIKENNEIFKEAQLNFKQSIIPIYFIHANYMVGIDNKINALKNKKLWFV